MSYADGMEPEVPIEVKVIKDQVPEPTIKNTQDIEEAGGERLSSLLSRKFLLAVALLVCVTWLLGIDKIDKSTWQWLVVWVSGTYFGSNVIQKINL
jgi:hypothetical protein